MFNIFNIIISFGALQGLIVGTWLFMKMPKSNDVKLYFATLLMGFSAILMKVTIIDIIGNPLLPLVHFNFIYLIAPSLYFYIYGLSQQDTKKSLCPKLHFITFLIVNVAYFMVYLSFHNSFKYQEILLNIIALDEGFSIIFFTFYFLRTTIYFKKNVLAYVPNVQQWIRRLLYAQFCFLLTWCGYILAEWSYFHYSLEVTAYYPLMILLSIMLYYMSLQVFMNKDIIYEIGTAIKRKIKVLNPKKSANLLIQLKELMSKEKPFLNENLSLVSLAAILNVNPKVLSYVINEHLHKNFNDYINEWRIEEVKIRLNEKSHGQLKLINIAYDCGFNSKSTFNLAFKKATGLSPSDYKNN